MKTKILIPITVGLIISFAIGLNAQVIVSEFLPDPANPLESEWVELYNFSDSAVELSGWKLCDLVGCAEIPQILIESGEYLILCQDSAAFALYYYNLDTKIIRVPGWRALNNSGDHIMLADSQGLAIDSFSYDKVNGANISWERIDPAIPGWNNDNWSRSLDPDGSTPGRINSVTGGFPPDYKLILIDKLFSPGSGRGDDNLVMEISLPRDCFLTLTVYDLDGRKVKVIFDQKALVSGQYLYDGRDSGGNYLATGMYILLAELTGKYSYSEKYVFGVAK